MPCQVWGVIGGGDKGGIIVREGQDKESPLLPERLHTGAWVKELALEGERLRYSKLQGGGPSTGWVSTRLTDRDLLAKGDDLWQVVGGGDKGGIVARAGQDKETPLLPERLSTGALVRELALVGERLQFDRLSGTGPTTGWVSTRLPDKELMAKLPQVVDGDASPAVPSADPPAPPPLTGLCGPPLEILMRNDEKDFSYEGLPVWVPKEAAVARLRREGKQYLPTPDEPLPRLGLLKPLAPFKKFPPNKLKEQLKTNYPGCIYGLKFPRTAEQIQSGEFGAEWFTNAFHAAGTLPKDNHVTKVVRCKEVSISGFQKEGGAAMKMFITVEYAKPDPRLHTELFAKYTYDPARNIPGVITFGQDDGPEVLISAVLSHLLPCRSPVFYYGDVSRENTAYIIITEAIPYGKFGTQDQCGPYDVLPGCGKCQDFMLPNVMNYYFALFRAMGRIGAWDKLGRFDGFFGPYPQYNEEQYLANRRQPQTKALLESTITVVEKQIDVGIDFLVNWCKKIAPPECRDEQKLQKVKEELVEMCPYFKDLSDYYQESNSIWVAANHANLQADNAWFWRDEYDDLTCGVLDWGGFRRSPFCVRFLGCLSGAEADDLLEYMDRICQNYVDEYEGCGGPKVSCAEVVQRYHLAFITSCYDQVNYVKRHTFEETTKEEMLAFTGVRDEKFQERFYTRCGSMPTINAYTYYIKKGNIKAMFDEWKAGVGKHFLTEYF